jgi:hypothetical protein
VSCLAKEPDIGSGRSRLDFDGGADRHETPDLFDLGVADCYATLGPIHMALLRAQPLISSGQAMNHDGPAWVEPNLSRTQTVSSVWIRNVKREVKLAVRVLHVEDVFALGSFVVALVLLRSNGVPAECDFVGLKDLASGIECEGAGGLDDNDVVSKSVSGCWF